MWLVDLSQRGGVVAGETPKSISGTHPEWEIFVTGGWWELPVTLWILILLALVATVFLHLSVAGRYFYALGSNETAARFSGISVDLYKIFAYVLCSTLVGLYSFLAI